MNEELIPALEAEELSVWLKKGKRQIAAVRNLKFTVKKVAVQESLVRADVENPYPARLCLGFWRKKSGLQKVL